MWRRSKRAAVWDLEEGSHQNPTALAPWPGTPASTAVRNAFLLFISHAVCGICYGSPKRLRHTSSLLSFFKKKLSIDCIKGNRVEDTNLNNILPWLVWLSGLSANLQTERLRVRFLVRAHAWVAGQVPSGGMWEVANGHVSRTLISLSLPSPLSKHK